MMLELAVGDAYGAGFEYVDRDIIARFNDLTAYRKHPRHDTPVGWYTDDTQMSIAIAEVVISGVDWTLFADSFVRAFKRDPRTGYAHGFYDLLTRVADGTQLSELIIPASDKSGAAMRAGPIGVLPDIDAVIECATIQARVTHDTPDGVRAAVAAALMTHYFLHERGAKADLGRFLEAHTIGNWAEPWQGKVKSKGWMSVHAAVTAVVQNDSLSRLLRSCIGYTGDVDTVATIALAAASCSEEYNQDIPSSLIWQLENQAYGRDYLIGIDKQLMALAM